MKNEPQPPIIFGHHFIDYEHNRTIKEERQRIQARRKIKSKQRG